MRRRLESGQPEHTEARFGFYDWLAAVIGLLALLAGSGIILGAVYWLVSK